MKRKLSVLFLLVFAFALVFTSCSIANKKVESLQILSGVPTEIEVNKTPDFSAIKVKATYNDGETKELGYSDVTISKIDTSKVGKVEYTVSYEGASAKATINVKAESSTIQTVTLESISYLSGIQTQFYVGADFHLTDLKVTAHYSDGSTKTIASDKLSVVQNIDRDTAGDQTLIVAYEGKQLEIKIKVLKIEPVRFSLVLNDFNTSVLVGKSFDTSLITGTLHYNNSSTKSIANSEITFAAVDTATAGQKKLVATYEGMNAECTVEVLGIKSIEFSGFATSIKFNEELDLSALKATVIATDNNDYEISRDKITVDKSDFDTTLTNTASRVTVISFEYCGAKKDYNVTVTADREDAELVSLTYVSGVKTNLFVGETFDDSKIIATANRSFGYSSIAKIKKADLTVSGEVENEAGTYTLTYSLTENGVTKSFTLEVVVKEPTATDIKLNKTDLGWVIKGEKLDTSSITATLSYDYVGKTTALKNSELTFAGINTDTAGDFELTVSYGGFEKKVTYTVVTAKEIKEIVGIDTSVSLGNAAYEAGEVEVEILLSNGVTVERTLNSGVVIDISAYDSTKVGNTTLTVKFGDTSKTITVEVFEELDELALESIAIQASSLKSSIFAGDEYDFSAIKIIATFNYNRTKTYGIADGVSVTATGSTEVAGSYVITASYTHNYVTKTASFTVEVKAVVATELEISGEFDSSILLGDKLDTSGITAILHYNNGTSETLKNTDLKFDIDVSAAGEKTLTVTHEATELTDTAKVTVVGIESVTFEGIEDRYRVNTAINSEKITVTIKGTDGETYKRDFNENVTLPNLRLTINTGKESKEYVFSYCGVEYKKNIEVYAEFEDAILIEIEYSGATRVLKGDFISSAISVRAFYTYGFEKEYRIADGVSFEGEVNTSVVGSYDITVSYLGKTANATVSVVIPNVIGIHMNSAPYGIVGEEYDYDSVNVTITLENQQEITSTLNNLADYGIMANVDVTAAGTKQMTFTANGNSYTGNINIAVYAIEKITIDTNDFDTVVQLNSAFSTEGLGKILVTLVGLQEPAIRWVPQDAFTHNVNTAIMSTNYELTASYLGVTSVPVKITVAQAEYIITGVDDPDGIESWKNETTTSKFLDSGYCYFVGDDNPFKYELEFKLFDIINKVGKTQGLEYTGKSTVTLDGVAVGDEYVIIDEINHTFHFTAAAIGKSFVITTAHAGSPEYSKTLPVTVVDGYNVDEAIELNLITNRNTTIGHSGYEQLKVLYTFLSSNSVAGINNMTEKEYKAFVDSIKGIIIHDKLVISQSDLPEEYFFITSNGDKYIWDHQSIYNHEFTEIKLDDPKETTVTPATFNIYGNYFTIVSHNVPTVAKDGLTNKDGNKSNDDDGLSSSQLFRFDISESVQSQAEAADKFYAENYVTNIYALALLDNDPSEPVQTQAAQDRSKLGVIGIKMRHGIYNLNALNMEAYFITTFPDNDDLVVNYDYCTFYNAWSNHIMTWALNSLDMTGDDKFDGSVHAGYQPITMNITNSFMGKCGGPVIITVNKSPSEEYNTAAGSKNIVNIDAKTKIFSYVKGTESWFQAYKATPLGLMIMGLNDSFKPNASFVTYVTNKEGTSSDFFMNMILLNMEAGLAIEDGQVTAGGSSDLDGYISIDGKTKLDMDDQSINESTKFNYGHDGVVDGIQQFAYSNYNMIPPIFVSDTGGASWTDMTHLYDVDGVPSAKPDGDYLAFYMYNLGVLFAYNEPDLKEPDPESFFSAIDWAITAPHGIE